VKNKLVRALAIAENTVRESLRNRIVYALLGVTALVMCLSLVLGWVTVEPQDKIRIVTNLCLSSIVLFGTIAAIFLGTNLIYQEVQQRTIYTLLARPLSRGEFIAGKYLGLIAVNGICLLATGSFFLIFLMLNGGSITLILLQALFMIFVELSVVTGIALLFSVIAHPIEGAVFAFVATLVGRSTGDLKELGKTIVSRQGEEVAVSAQLGLKLLDVIYILLPNLSNFNLSIEVASSIPASWIFMAQSTGYGLAYMVILYTLADWGFSRKML
jgi:Cu-processing system permease protein